MRSDQKHATAGPTRKTLSGAVLASLLSVLLASCTSSSDSQPELAGSNFATSGAAALSAVDGATEGAEVGLDAGTAPAVDAAGGQLQPTEEAAQPTPKPEESAASVAANAPAQAEAEGTAADEAAAAPVTPSAGSEAAPAVAGTAPAVAQPPLIDKKKQTFLSAFFGGAPKKPAAKAVQPLVDASEPAADDQGEPVAEPAPAKAKPLIQLASAKSEDDVAGRPSASFGSENALPGVRQTMLFEIKRKSGIDDDSDIDLHEEEGDGMVQLASAAGLARLAPNGLMKQRESVDTACLKPSLVRVLKTAEARFGKRLIITSGYRSPQYNRKVRGAKNSQHMYCAAADVQMPGVSKWELAKYFRSMSGRGGVGTYCHTESVHVDIGPERDWNWRCRRRG